MAAHYANQGLFEHVQHMLTESQGPDDVLALNDVLDALRRFPAAIYTKPHFELLLGTCDLSAKCKAAATKKLPKRGKKRSRAQVESAQAHHLLNGETGALPEQPPRDQSSAAAPSHSSRPPRHRQEPQAAQHATQHSQTDTGRPQVWGIFADTASGVKRTGKRAGEGIQVHREGWEVVLLLDTREVKSRRDRDYLGSHLRAKGVTVETRQLPLGDMLWVARPKSVPGVRLRVPAAASQAQAAEEDAGDTASEASLAVSKGMWPHEWLLSVIVERKRVSDLSASILDGRYEEQKRRLLACPCQRVVYVIEGDLARRDVLTSKGLVSSIASTTVHSGFLVQRTSSVDGSIEFLASMHAALQDSFLPSGGGSVPLLDCQCIPSPPLTYATFVAESAKPVATTALQLFGMQLRQIKGMSAPRAETVLERFPTPYLLHRELKRLAGMQADAAAASQRGSQAGSGVVPVTSVAANKLFAKVHVPGQKAVFGGKLSERLAAFYGQGTYDDSLF